MRHAMEPRPVKPTDPRWKPNRTVLVLGVIVQFVLIGSAVWYSEMTATVVPATPPKLVSEVISPEDAVFADTDISARKGKQLPPVDVRKAALADPKQLSDGFRLFTENCASCHGPSGRGDGPAGKTLKPTPRDLTRLTGWKNPTRLSDVFRTVTVGLAGTQMPAFDYLTHEQRFATAHFVVSLAPGRQIDTEATLAALDQEFALSAGAKEPNVIPLATAMDRMLAERAATPALRESATIDDEAGQEVFKKVVEPGGKDRLLKLLTTNQSWREDVARLKVLATVDPIAAGFRPRVRLLADTEWQTLHVYLKGRYPLGDQ
ncbi:MAG: cytochrome c [Acidobacteria bacterium]|nr:MAG: cytochrome c [Acidobacteriota bacterium]